MEEIGLSHIINSEGEKLQYVLGTLTDVVKPNPTIPEILEVNESIKDMLNVVSMNQMFLFGKMSAALNAYFKNQNAKDPNGGEPLPDKPPIQEIPAVAAGRILTPQKTGDTADWVEIAQNGGYSLIVRTKFINTFASSDQRENPDYQATIFGTANGYGDSAVRKKINDWFTGAAKEDADNLAADANLRKFTVKSDAAAQTGTGTAGTDGKTDSFSKPSGEAASSGLDVAFALSYSEAANFVSDEYGWGGDNFLPSEAPAQSNFAKLTMPAGSQLWLRSPGSTPDMASSLSQSGKVFQAAVDGSNGGSGLLYPALWVDSAAF
jgi:hypothetical protein